MSQPFEYLQDRLHQFASIDRLRMLRPVQVDGTKIRLADGRELINFGSNDYLGIAAQQTVSSVATGSGASSLVCGWTNQHETLANRIAEFETTESAVIFPSGFAACSGTIATLAEPDDLILSDELNHASIIDGCRLSRSDRQVYKHRDMNVVRSTLADCRSKYKHVWIVTDSVFSMDGHIAPLNELAEIAAEYGATVIVDEAHATGVLGESGTGLCEAMGAKNQIPIRIGTLSKAIGSQGGFVAGPKVVIDYLVNQCRSLIFSTALSPAAVQASLNSLQVISNEPARRKHVQEMARLVRSELSLGSISEIEAVVPIVSIPIGSDSRAVAKSTELTERGFYVPAIRPPTVPEGTARLRVSLSAAHTEQEVRALVRLLVDH